MLLICRFASRGDSTIKCSCLPIFYRQYSLHITQMMGPEKALHSSASIFHLQNMLQTPVLPGGYDIRRSCQTCFRIHSSTKGTICKLFISMKLKWALPDRSLVSHQSTPKFRTQSSKLTMNPSSGKFNHLTPTPACLIYDTVQQS
jgi:hypothetical protein